MFNGQVVGDRNGLGVKCDFLNSKIIFVKFGPIIISFSCTFVAIKGKSAISIVAIENSAKRVVIVC